MNLNDNKTISDIFFVYLDSPSKDGSVSVLHNLSAMSYYVTNEEPKVKMFFKHETKENLSFFQNLYNEIVAELRNIHSLEKEDCIEYNHRLKNSKGVFFNLRCHWEKIIGGHSLNIRTKPGDPPLLEYLDILPGVKEVLLSEYLCNGGLILFSAVTGEGKTTSATATCVSRLVKFGGHCNAYEDPPEYSMQGNWGENGTCLQTDVNDDFRKHLKGALRRYTIMPNSIIYLGEIRDEQTAKQALIASSQGHLVISTIHARSVDATLKKLVEWASFGDNRESSADLLASTFRFCFHQQKIYNPNAIDEWKKFNIRGSVLFSLTDEHMKNFKSNIIKAEFNAFDEVISRQKIAIAKFSKGGLSKDDLFQTS